MKKSILIIGLMVACIYSQAQNLVGFWSGIINMGDKNLNVNLNVSSTGDSLTSVLCFPYQEISIKANLTKFEKSVFTARMDSVDMWFQGRLVNGNTLQGIFVQLGKTYQLALTNDLAEKQTEKQLPRKYNSYSYYIDSVSLEGNTNIATLTYPIKKGKISAVILVCDYQKENCGKTEIDELANHLAANGIAVIRSESENSTNFTDAAIKYLRTRPEIKTDCISVVKLNESTMIGNCKKANVKQYYKEISKSTTAKTNSFNQITRWLLKIA